MLVDGFGRRISYLRISVTDRCNFRCVYCMPEGGISLKRHEDILSFEDIVKIAGKAGAMGMDKVRLTGGEPLVRRGISRLVAMLSETGMFSEITMTTNAALLDDKTAAGLAAAGLGRINISLDTLAPARFREITRCGELSDVMRGIDAAVKAGLEPVKINMVVFDRTTEEEIDLMRGFCDEKGMALQTIRHFSLFGREHQGGAGTFDRPPPCARCNRLRLTADGCLKPCLFSDREIKVDMENIEKSILEALSAKPLEGTSCSNRSMYQIGG